MPPQRHYRQLKEELAKLKAPPGLEDLAMEPESAPSVSPSEGGTSSSSNPECPAPVLPSVEPPPQYDPELVQHV